MRVAVKFEYIEAGERYGMKRPVMIDERDLADHGTLCRAFGLDPIRTKFDLPDSWAGGSQRGDNHRSLRRIKNGIVFFHDGNDYKPLGKITQVHPDEKIRDQDQTDPRTFFDLDALR